jgi:hypothetical protein
MPRAALATEIDGGTLAIQRLGLLQVSLRPGVGANLDHAADLIPPSASPGGASQGT